MSGLPSSTPAFWPRRRSTANDSFSHETVFADLRLAAMKREREPSSKAYRQDRFENTERAAKETIEAEQRARREKTERLKELRLSKQGAKDPATK
ncbi:MULTISPECIES: hypothetical protein [Rhizobium]|uniref:Uncharacterized protein n=1 Tax=Rhizobium leguminosarum TaxID=384 RepID=A0A7M3DWP8_RHILE|nr:hypothetical protein [Rhizobium leguminosarum]NKK45804.1 hypothetical protein [Rhizobium leguminosarum bv. viciae]TAY53114.1 hypothetical protein ELH90_16525 [Rhizobium leguminosarum]